MPGISAIGKMDRRITFQEIVYDDTKQNRIESWTNIDRLATVNAELEERTGTEAFEGDQVVSVTSASFRIRFRTDITVENRIIYNSKIYNILAILEVGRRKYLKIICESGGQYTGA